MSHIVVITFTVVFHLFFCELIEVCTIFESTGDI